MSEICSEPPPDPFRLSGLLTIQEVAERLDCSERTVRRLVAEKQIEHIRMGQGQRGRLRFRPASVDKYLAGRTIRPSAC